MIRFIPLRWVIIFIGVLVLIPFLILQNFYEQQHINNFFKSVTIAVPILSLIESFGLWRWLWRIHPRFFNTHIFPDIQGTYEGTLISSWNGRTEIPGAKLIIKQSLFCLKIKQISSESISFSKIADIVHFDKDLNIFKLYYIYLNEPRDSARDRSLPHIGAADLTISINDIIILDGRYFNDSKSRVTTGEMNFKRIDKKANF